MMNNLSDMIWIELHKAIRSKMPLATALGSLFMPAGIAFLIFVSKNPEISQKLGLISAKAELVAYSATDWTTYLALLGQMIAAGGFFIFVLVTSWVFGREFADGTLKDMLAVPVRRSSILLAKFILVAVWSAVLSMEMLIFGLVMGAVVQLQGGSSGVVLQAAALVLITAGLVIAAILPFALFASAGRGYLLPLGMAVLTLMMANFAAVVGWGEYFPWTVPGLFAQGKTPLTPASYFIVVLTGLLGMLATHAWWMRTDQSK